MKTLTRAIGTSILSLSILFGCEKIGNRDELEVVRDAKSGDAAIDMRSKLTARASAGDANAMVQLGYVALDQEISEASVKDALAWFKKAAENGDAHAKFAYFIVSTTKIVPTTDEHLNSIGHYMEEALAAGDLVVSAMDPWKNKSLPPPNALVNAAERGFFPALAVLGNGYSNTQYQDYPSMPHEDLMKAYAIRRQISADWSRRAYEAKHDVSDVAVGRWMALSRFFNRMRAREADINQSMSFLTRQCSKLVSPFTNPADVVRGAAASNVSTQMATLQEYAIFRENVVRGRVHRPYLDFDPKTSDFTWDEKGAALSNPISMRLIGERHKMGYGVPQDYVKAVTWYTRAANGCNVGAMFDLAKMYVNGLGVPKDMAMAHALLNLAASGDWFGESIGLKLIDLNELRQELGRSMKADDLKRAQEISSSWHPDPEIFLGRKPVDFAGGIPTFTGVERSSSGTGFFVSSNLIVSNFHVGGSCKKIAISSQAKNTLTVRAKSQVNDLVLLESSQPTEGISILRRDDDISIGEMVTVFGFPLSGQLATTGNLTTGVVSALTGLGNDLNYLQMTAPIQPGNSGGPLLDAKGNVIGVVTGKLDTLHAIKATGDIPQNVNFSIRLRNLFAFLDVNGVKYERASYLQFSKQSDAIAKDAVKYTVPLLCTN